jgi:hypothetical protein
MVQDNPEGNVSQTVIDTLKRELDDLWRKIMRSPESYIMTQLEYKLFACLREDLDARNARVAQRAAMRYWDRYPGDGTMWRRMLTMESVEKRHDPTSLPGPLATSSDPAKGCGYHTRCNSAYHYVSYCISEGSLEVDCRRQLGLREFKAILIKAYRLRPLLVLRWRGEN